LLGRGAGSDVCGTNAAGKSALFAACWRSFPEVASLLLEKGAKVHQVDEHGRTALWAAGRGGSAECVKVILDAGGDPDAMDDRQGAFEAGAGVASCTPLFAAVWCGNFAACKMLLEEVCLAPLPSRSVVYALLVLRCSSDTPPPGAKLEPLVETACVETRSRGTNTSGGLQGADPKLGDSEKRTPMEIAETDELKALLQEWIEKHDSDDPAAMGVKTPKGKGTFKKE
jgi:ankyrin repeat protein